MPSSYTSNLRLTLPVQGELSGTWGDTVNTGITALVDTAIAGTASISVTSADVTLTSSNGVADQARSMVLNLTGTSTASFNVICPASSKLYVVRNNTTGGFAHTIKTSAGSGISVPNGASVTVYCDGTSVLNAASYNPSLTLGAALPVASGGTGSTTASGARTSLDAQQTLVSGTNIKTVGGTSLLGSGDIPVGTGDVTLTGTQTLTNKTLGAGTVFTGTALALIQASALSF